MQPHASLPRPTTKSRPHAQSRRPSEKSPVAHDPQGLGSLQVTPSGSTRGGGGRRLGFAAPHVVAHVWSVERHTVAELCVLTYVYTQLSASSKIEYGSHYSGSWTNNINRILYESPLISLQLQPQLSSHHAWFRIMQGNGISYKLYPPTSVMIMMKIIHSMAAE